MKLTEKSRPDLVGDGYDVTPLYDAKQVAALLRIPPKSVYDLPIPCIRISRNRVRWAPVDVREFIQHRTEN